MNDKQKPKLNEIVKQRQKACYDMVNGYVNKVVRMVVSDVEFHEINNKLIDLRNSCVEFIHESITEMVGFFEYKVAIKSGSQKNKKPMEKEFHDPCQICGEKRISNLCHVIPRKDGGLNEAGNYIVLCPTHHFLLDHGRLNKDEFEAIDTTKISERAKEYFEKIHRKRHQLKWRYHTNRFTGCDCGSIDFEFVPDERETYIVLGLRCLHCGKRWCNLWEQKHPLGEYGEDTILDVDEDITEAERAERMKQARAKVQKYIDEKVPQILRELS